MPKPTPEELEKMFEKLWTSYPADLCKGKRGGRQPAFRAFKKINPDEAEFNRIMGNMKAMIKADRSDKDPYRWPFVSSYLNQARYDDFIMPKNESSVQELTHCCIEKCSNKVHGASFKYCADHVPNAHSDLLAQAWTRSGIDYKSPTFVDDCRKQCRSYMNALLGKVNEN